MSEIRTHRKQVQEGGAGRGAAGAQSAGLVARCFRLRALPPPASGSSRREAAVLRPAPVPSAAAFHPASARGRLLRPPRRGAFLPGPSRRSGGRRRGTRRGRAGRGRRDRDAERHPERGPEAAEQSRPHRPEADVEERDREAERAGEPEPGDGGRRRCFGAGVGGGVVFDLAVFAGGERRLAGSRIELLGEVLLPAPRVRRRIPRSPRSASGSARLRPRRRPAASSRAAALRPLEIARKSGAMTMRPIS